MDVVCVVVIGNGAQKNGAEGEGEAGIVGGNGVEEVMG